MSDLLVIRPELGAELEIRGDGRTIYGLAAPYGVVATVRDPGTGRVHGETFDAKTFTRALEGEPGRVKFYVNHSHREGGLPVGRALSLRNDARGVVGEYRVAATEAGDEAIELVRSGVLDAMSVGFLPNLEADQWSSSRDMVLRVDADLRETSVVAAGAYAGAAALGIRRLEIPTTLAARGRAQAILLRHGVRHPRP